jgi:hypothetical protein
LPAEARQSLRELAGCPVLALDLSWVRRQVEVWPCVRGVDVHLVLPGTLHIEVKPASARASIAVGRGWHGVSREGRLAGSLAAPRTPLLIGFPLAADDLRDGMAAAERVARLSGASVEAVRRITPTDLEMRLVLPGEPPQRATVNVTPRGSAAEQRWCELVRSGEMVGNRLDLRFDDRLVTSAGGGW